MNLKHCTPSDLPQEILQYDGDIAQMGVGKSGKIGFLELELQNDSDKQKTIITKKQTQVPLYVQKALHYDLDYPSMAHVFILSPSGGILQGDRYRMDVELRNNAISHITTQGATRIYKMESNYATHMVTLNLKDNSYLEFIPEQIIPYKNSRFYQKTNLQIDDSSTVVYSETIVPGRIAMGEMFDDKTILTSVYILTKKHVTKVNDMINELFSHTQNISGGSSILPNDSGISIRILGNSSEDQKTTIYEILKIIRKEILPEYL